MAKVVIALGTAMLGATLLAQAGMNDPTRPPPGFGLPPGQAPAEAPLVVGGIFLMGTKPYALVDGMTVRVGDRLGEARVTRIDHQGVWLQGGAGKRLLKLAPEVEKRPAEQTRISTEKKP